MNRLEIIHLRLAGNCPPGLIEAIRESIITEGELRSVRFYRNATITSDLGIHIHLQTVGDQPRPSDFGLRIASALRDHGMVDHTIWIEE